MSAQIIILKEWLSDRTQGAAEQLFLPARMEDMRREATDRIESMISDCADMLAHYESRIIVEAQANLIKLRDALQCLPLYSPGAAKIYCGMAELVEQIGELVAQEIREQVNALSR